MTQRLPVILLGGFFGAGKTSLLHHLISEHQGGHLAILVENPGTLALDAKALRGLCQNMRRTYDTVKEIPTLDDASRREWLAATLREFAEAGRYERVLIELNGGTNPVHWGREFGLLPGHEEAFAPWATLQHMVTVVDALDFYRGMVLPAQKKDPSPWVNFQHAQIEAASLLVLNKCDLVDDAIRMGCTRLLRLINPDALIIETAYGEIEAPVWQKTGTLQQVGLAVERRLRPKADGTIQEMTEQDAELSCVHYRAFRPFHPGRFWEWFNAEHAGLIRVKGLVWLATRNLLVGGVSRTRWQNSCGAAGVWWAALPREDWPEDVEALAKMQEVWREPYGDRRQDLVLIGAQDKNGTRDLEACLLTEEEYARPVREWNWADPFPEWDLQEG